MEMRRVNRRGDTARPARRLAALLCAVLLLTLLPALLAGCGKPTIRAGLPELGEGARMFSTFDYVNPDDPEDGYRAFFCDGRIYVPYGVVKSFLPDGEAAACLGFICQEGVEMRDVRIYSLASDPGQTLLMEVIVNDVMGNPYFYRAIDTRGQDAALPAYAESLGYAIWER